MNKARHSLRAFSERREGVELCNLERREKDREYNPKTFVPASSSRAIIPAVITIPNNICHNI